MTSGVQRNRDDRDRLGDGGVQKCRGNGDRLYDGEYIFESLRG